MVTSRTFGPDAVWAGVGAGDAMAAAQTVHAMTSRRIAGCYYVPESADNSADRSTISKSLNSHDKSLRKQIFPCNRCVKA